MNLVCSRLKQATLLSVTCIALYAAFPRLAAGGPITFIIDLTVNEDDNPMFFSEGVGPLEGIALELEILNADVPIQPGGQTVQSNVSLDLTFGAALGEASTALYSTSTPHPVVFEFGVRSGTEVDVAMVLAQELPMVLLDSTGGDSFPALVDVLIGMPPSPFFPTVGGLCPEGFVIEELIDFLCEGGSRQWEPFAPGGTLAIVSVSIRSNPTVNLTASVTSVRVVPEPSSMALSAIGVIAVTLFVRVGRKKATLA